MTFEELEKPKIENLHITIPNNERTVVTNNCNQCKSDDEYLPCYFCRNLPYIAQHYSLDGLFWYQIYCHCGFGINIHSLEHHSMTEVWNSHVKNNEDD